MDSSDEVFGALDAFSILSGAGTADLLLGAEQSSSGSFSVPASSGDDSSATASQGSVSGKGRKRMLSDGVPDGTQFEGILDYLAKANRDSTNAIFENMKTGSSLVEDFAAMVARDGAISATTEITAPFEGEDFVAYLARTNGIRDDTLIRQMRHALMWNGNSKIEQPSAASTGPSGNDINTLSVGEEEDAMSFFVRAGSWDSSSSISQDLASAGLAEDEDAASYLMRTGNLTADSDELSRYITSGPLHQPRPTKSGLSSSRSQPGPVSPGQGKRKLIVSETERLKREKLLLQVGQTV